MKYADPLNLGTGKYFKTRIFTRTPILAIAGWLAIAF